jgi:iron complex transport system ATP-binding protein
MAEKLSLSKSQGPLGQILQARNLGFNYSGKTILKDFSWSFCPGRVYFLAGPNGAGKSTLLTLLARLQVPVSGSISINGQNIEAISSGSWARLLAFCPQKFNFTLPFTVEEIVAMGRRPYLGRWGRLKAADDFMVKKSLALLHIDHLAQRPVTQLSGGEAQRTVIARTLAQETGIILLDEPTASLDIAQSLDLMNLLKALALEGRTIVVVSHDLALAGVYAQEMVFLKNGLLTAAGPAGQTLTASVLEEVFEAQAMVRADDFTGGVGLSFRAKVKK